MWSELFLLAENDELNQWLEENPHILGSIVLTIGLLILAFGLKDLLTGQARSKYGRKMTGSSAHLMGIMRIVIGSIACLYGLYRLLAG